MASSRRESPEDDRIVLELDRYEADRLYRALVRTRADGGRVDDGDWHAQVGFKLSRLLNVTWGELP